MLTTLFLAAMLMTNGDMVSQVTEVDVQADRPARVLTVAGPPVAVGEVWVVRPISDMAYDGMAFAVTPPHVSCHPHEMIAAHPEMSLGFARSAIDSTVPHIFFTPATGD